MSEDKQITTNHSGEESNSPGSPAMASYEQAEALADTLNAALAYGVDPDIMESLARASSGLVGVRDNDGIMCILCAFQQHSHNFIFHGEDDDSEFGVHWGTDLEFEPLRACL